MTVNANVKLDVEDKLDFIYCLTSLNTVHDYIVRPLPKDMPKEKVEEYYEGLMKRFKEAKVMEHELRCKFSDKYGIPYAFGFNDGEILIDDGNS